MIISHKYEFIFLKTYKTAGTSLEVYLSQYCGESDILTPIHPLVPGHIPKNYKGVWNPMPEITSHEWINIRSNLGDFLRGRRFYNHIPARVVKNRISTKTWNKYFKFCIERNPWDKTLSHYHMIKDRTGEGFSLEQYFDSENFCLNYPLYTDRNNNIIVDRVIKYEYLMDELSQVFDKLSIPFNGILGVSAKSEHRQDRRPYWEVFSSEQGTKIEQAFEKEIFMHNYMY